MKSISSLSAHPRQWGEQIVTPSNKGLFCLISAKAFKRRCNWLQSSEIMHISRNDLVTSYRLIPKQTEVVSRPSRMTSCYVTVLIGENGSASCSVLSGPVDNALFVRERKEYINFGDLMVKLRHYWLNTSLKAN